ncbi:MAG: helix-turn-helix domain-containing protein [Bacteroidales bacterium]|jgi:transcriptional regulator with XRE-family HTH domain|nr:helix-turn-helix domain-containing protein [Bacteroidales bacterium]
MSKTKQERQRIGTRIKEEREKRGLTQAELASMAGITESNLYRIENGHYSAKFDDMQSIADAMNLDADLISKSQNSSFII